MKSEDEELSLQVLQKLDVQMLKLESYGILRRVSYKDVIEKLESYFVFSGDLEKLKDGQSWGKESIRSSFWCGTLGRSERRSVVEV